MFVTSRDRLVSTFVDLVKIPSPSWRESDVIRYIETFMKKRHIPIEKYPCGDSYNLLVRMKGNTGGIPVLFSCHMDTVTPCENVKPVITDRKITSDGSTILGSDDKGAISGFLEAIDVLLENNIPHGPVEFLFSCAEEIGLYGIKGFDLSKVKSRYAYIFDSDGAVGNIILQAPYHSTMELNVKGKAAHAGMEPEKGVSAIRLLADILSSIPHGRIDHETTVNAGIISGGRATNIVAENAYCKLEVRSLNREKLTRVEQEIQAISRQNAEKSGGKAKIQRKLEYSGFSLKEDDDIIQMAIKSMSMVKIKPSFGISGGGSDTNVINAAGIKAVNLSSGMQKVHTTSEYIMIKDLEKIAQLTLAIIATAMDN
jgi:tripeptide aminopeptidase